MDAKSLGAAALLAATLPRLCLAANFRTENFVVTAPTEEFARQVAEAAEYYRHHLAIVWLGTPLEGRWSRPCPIRCKVGQLGAGGATTFTFNNGEVFGWNMNIQGSEERILDSVLPHEVSHMIFACHFRRPLPRWADEGAATLVEHESERMRQTKLLNQVIQTSHRIPLRDLLSIREYPRDMQDVLTLYAEGYSLADFLVQQKGAHGRQIFLDFLGDALVQGWDAAFSRHYGFDQLSDVEQQWTGWVMAGSPPLTRPEGQQLAAVEPNGTATDVGAPPDDLVVRSQNPQQPRSGSSDGPLAPLASMTRPLRRTLADAALAAPSPRSLTATAPQQTQPISVHPARPATVTPANLGLLPRVSRPPAAAPPAADWTGFPSPRSPYDATRIGSGPGGLLSP
jgi:hypothetical protein